VCRRLQTLLVTVFKKIPAKRRTRWRHSPYPKEINCQYVDDSLPAPVLDMGAAGVIVPQVNTAGQARDVVRYAKYAPTGQRGVGVSRAHGYGYAVADYIARANQDTAVIVQAQHIDAVRDIEAITDVSALDAVLIGPYDLSASMGKMGQVDNPEVVAAIGTVATTGRRKNLRLGFFGVSANAVRARIAEGFTLIAAGVDTMLLGQAASSLCRDLKAAPAKR
jgi:2-keto-3-deoxy-L-rhamnonate aldolase RhmA